MKKFFLPFFILFFLLSPLASNGAPVTVSECKNYFLRMMLPTEDMKMIHLYYPAENANAVLPKTVEAKSPDYLTGMKKTFANALRKPSVLHAMYASVNGKTVDMGDLGAQGLMDLLEPGQMYNIVVLGDEVRIMKVIKDPKGEKFTKHIVISDYSEDVRFAGEVSVDETRTILTVNNNSGTFQPEHEDAKNVAELLRNIFRTKNIRADEKDFGALYKAKSKVAADGSLPVEKLEAATAGVEELPVTPAKPGLFSAKVYEAKMALLAREKGRAGTLFAISNKEGSGSERIVRLGDHLGTGFFGSVFRVKGINPIPKEIADYPGKVVIKVPNNYYGVKPLQKISKGEIDREYESYKLLQDKLAEIEASPLFPKDPAWEKGKLPIIPILLHETSADGAVLFKAEVPGKSLHSMLTNHEVLSPEMLQSIEEIKAFTNSVRSTVDYVHLDGVASGSNTKFSIDNNSKNFVWVEDPKLLKQLNLKRPSFVFYEGTPLRNRPPFEMLPEVQKNISLLEVDINRIIPFNSLDSTLERSAAWVKRYSDVYLQSGRIPKYAAVTNPPKRMNPKEILFAQEMCENGTKDGKFTVLSNAVQLREGTLNPEKIPPIRIWKDTEGRIWTLDHRRLASYRLAGNLDSVPVEWASEELVKQQRFKFQTETNGKAIVLDIGNDTGIVID